jgi:hypothetical protein
MVLFMGIMVMGCSKKANAQEEKGTKTEKEEKAERGVNGQYRIGSKIKIYDSELKPTDAYFSYLSPSFQWKYKGDIHKTVLLNLSIGMGVNEAYLFGITKSEKNEAIGHFKNSIDKSIEWAATAKQNNIHSLKKDIPTPDGYKNKTFADTVQFLGNPPPTSITSTVPVHLMFTFYIGDFGDLGLAKKEKEETWLFMFVYDNYATRIIDVFGFRENDFASLKKFFPIRIWKILI